VLDLGDGYGIDGFWINLKPGVFAKDPRAAWIQKDELRHAISMAVDRDLFLNTVYFGAGLPVFGPVAPANKKWYSRDLPHVPHDPAQAKALLASIGLTDRNGDGLLEDAQNQPARFTVITQKGRTDRERATAAIRDEHREDRSAGRRRPARFRRGRGAALLGGQCEAIYFGGDATDTDPAISLDFG
jgi:peptide/nickel transport system substrate-binding protein